MGCAAKSLCQQAEKLVLNCVVGRNSLGTSRRRVTQNRLSRGGRNNCTPGKPVPGACALGCEPCFLPSSKKAEPEPRKAGMQNRSDQDGPGAESLGIAAAIVPGSLGSEHVIGQTFASALPALLLSRQIWKGKWVTHPVREWGKPSIPCSAVAPYLMFGLLQSQLPVVSRALKTLHRKFQK